MKKVIKLLCIFTVLMSLVIGVLPVNAEEIQKDYKTEIQTLTGFGIISGYSSESYANRKSITYNDFLSYLIKARYANSLKGDSVKLAKEIGIIDATDDIKGTSAVITDVAVKAILRVLGYENYVQLTKHTYFQVAYEIGLLDGASIKENEKLNSDNMLVMLYNMLDINLFAQVDKDYKQLDDTVITRFHKLTKVSGIVTANEFSGIYSSQEGRKGQIRIDDTYYETNGVDFNEMLGMNVEAYFSEDSGAYTIKCMFAKGNKNDEIVISAELFSKVNDSITQISYYKDEVSERVFTKNLSKTLKVIYNGQMTEKYNAELFDISDGEIRLLDNNSDGAYDYAFITDYELIFVSKADASNQVIYSDYELKAYSGEEINLKKLDFSDMKLNENIFIYRNGKNVDFSDISENDIICMARSAYGDDNVVKLYITRQSQNIEVTGIVSGKNEIKTDEATFKLNENYAEMLKNGSNDVVKFEIGNSYNVYLDRDGKIAGAQKTGTNGENYILIYNIYRSDSGDSTLVRCVDTANTHHEFAISEKVRIDDVQYKDTQRLYNAVNSLFGTVVKVKYNTKNEISKIEKATLQDETDTSETFNCAEKQSLTYRSGAGTVSFGGKYYVDGNTTVFASMDNTSRSADDWQKVMLSRIYLTDNNSYDIKPYAIDEYGYAKVILLDANTASIQLNMLVDSVITGLDEDGLPVQKLIGPVGSIVSLEVPASNDNVFDGLESGEYVTVTIDYKGKATKTTPIYSPKDGVKYSKMTDSTFYSSNGSYMGTLNKIDYGAMRMQLNCGQNVTPKNFDMQWLEPTVYIYESGQITIGNVNDLDIGDMIVMNTSYDRPSTIIAYK